MTGVDYLNICRHLNFCRSYNTKIYVETIVVLESLEWTYGPTSLQALVLDILYSPRLSHLLWRWNIFKLLIGFSLYKPCRVLQATPFLFSCFEYQLSFLPIGAVKTPEILFISMVGYQCYDRYTPFRSYCCLIDHTFKCI